MDDDYFKGLNGQASHNSISNTLGVLQQEQENRLKKERENFNTVSHHIPTPKNTNAIDNAAITKSASSGKSKEKENHNVKNREITAEEAYGIGLAALVVGVIALFLMLLPIGLILLGIWAGVYTFKNSKTQKSNSL